MWFLKDQILSSPRKRMCKIMSALGLADMGGIEKLGKVFERETTCGTKMIFGTFTRSSVVGVYVDSDWAGDKESKNSTRGL